MPAEPDALLRLPTATVHLRVALADNHGGSIRRPHRSRAGWGCLVALAKRPPWHNLLSQACQDGLTLKGR